MVRIFQLIAAGFIAFAVPAGSVRHEPAAPKARAVAAVAQPREPVPGIVLFGMGVAGLAIVGASARRRQPGRSVSS